MKQLCRLIPLVISAAVIATVPGFAGAAAPPDAVRYWDRTDDGSKLRLTARGDRVTNIVFHGDTVCRRPNGNLVEPYFGTGVTSGFNNTDLKKSGDFRSHQEYRGRYDLVRNLVGSVETRNATVRIRYRAPVKRNGPDIATCRTGTVEFKLHRVE